MTIVDPLETVLVYLQGDYDLSDLTGGQIAAKHRYGEEAPGGWAAGSTSLTVNLDGGRPELYAPVQDVRLEVIARAGSKAEAMAVLLRMQELSRATNRVRVMTSQGAALLYFLVPDSGSSLPYDADLGMDEALAFYRALVAEGEIS